MALTCMPLHVHPLPMYLWHALGRTTNEAPGRPMQVCHAHGGGPMSIAHSWSGVMVKTAEARLGAS